jgi:glycosyltransferase involved in cell wall biosynthesis
VNKLKIGVFTDSYKPYTSGVVRSIDTFTSELSALGHEIYIFAPNYPKCEKETGVFRFPSVPAPTHPNYSLALPFSFRMRNIVQKLNLDIIHVHSPFLLGRVGARYAKRLQIPLVFTFHTLYEEYVHYVPFAHGITKDLTQRLSTDFCNQCDLVVTPTRVISEYIKSLGVKTPVVNIPTGIQVEDYGSGDANWLQKTFGMLANEKILLCVGRLGKEKNLQWLLEATALVEREYSNIRLVLVGEGPEKNNLKNKAKELGIDKKLTFTGMLPKEKVIHCYKSSDVFIFSSVTETQGLVIGEAKAAGLPVVAVKAYGVSEMVEHEKDGFLTDLNKEEFAGRVLQILKDDNLKLHMSQQAVTNVNKISSRNCALKLLRHYLDMVQKNNSPLHYISSH